MIQGFGRSSAAQKEATAAIDPQFGSGMQNGCPGWLVLLKMDPDSEGSGCDMWCREVLLLWAFLNLVIRQHYVTSTLLSDPCVPHPLPFSYLSQAPDTQGAASGLPAIMGRQPLRHHLQMGKNSQENSPRVCLTISDSLVLGWLRKVLISSRCQFLLSPLEVRHSNETTHHLVAPLYVSSTELEEWFIP